MMSAAPSPRARAQRIGWLLTCVLAVGLLAVIGILASGAVTYFSAPDASLSGFATGTTWTEHGGGLWPFVVGTLVVAALSLAFAVPLALLVAIFLSEIAAASTRSWLKPTIELLAGIPPVVYGYFAVTALGPALGAIVPGAETSALVAGIAIALMITPNLSSLFDDALFRIPRGIREGAYALGANRVSALGQVLLPAARPALVAATLLSLSRAAGESIIVLFLSRPSAGGLPFNPLEPAVTITSHTLRSAEAGAQTPGYQSSFALLLLLAMVSMLIHRSSRRLRRPYSGGVW